MPPFAGMMGAPTMPQGARPLNAPTLDQRIVIVSRNIEELDRALAKLNIKAEEVKAQLLKAIGAREMLIEMKTEQAEQDAQLPPQDETPQGTIPSPPEPENEPESDPHESEGDSTPDGRPDEVDSEPGDDPPEDDQDA